MNILVTGHRGFVGLATVRALKENGHRVVGFDIMDGHDIRDLESVDSAVADFYGSMEEYDRILHLAAIARFDEADADPVLTHETNVLGTMNVVSVARKYHIPLVFASTGSAYMPIQGEPPIDESFPIKGNSVYGCSKALAELYIRRHTPHIILRYAHLYGAEKRNHGLIGGFVSRIERGLSPVLFGGTQSNDFTYVNDVAQANVLALESSWDAWNQCYNIGTGEELTAEEAGRHICEATGYKGEIEVREQRTVDAQRFVFDISKTRRMLGYDPKYSFKEGLEDMFKGDK